MKRFLPALAGFLEYLSRPLVPPGRAVSYILASTPAALLLGLALGRLWLPLLQALTFYPLFCGLLLRRQGRRALLAALGWALWTALLVGGISQAFPQFAQQRILLAESYQAEMFHWIQTGAGAEGDIRLFLPQHLAHLAAFTLLTLISAGLLSLVMGSVLMNYMSFYAGTLLAQATDPLPLMLLAWPPWAVLRVTAFILLATALSDWVLHRLRPQQAATRPLQRYLVAGLALIGGDIFLKWLLAPLWREWLLGLTHWP